MTAEQTRQLLRDFGDTIDFNQAFVIIAARHMDIMVRPTGDKWECSLIDRDKERISQADTPLDAIRGALKKYWLDSEIDR